MSVSDRITKDEEQFQRVFNYFQEDRERLVRNMRMEWGVNWSQWPEEIVSQLRDEGRPPIQFNIMTQKIISMAGLFLKNQFDVKFEPASGKVNTLTMKLQDLYYSVKNSMDWDASYADFLVKALIQEACEEIVIDTKDNPYGDINYRSIDPMNFFRDPNWTSPSSYDLEYCFTIADMSPQQIYRKYNKSTEELKEEMLRQKMEGVEYGEFKEIGRYKDLNEKWGSAHRVIEYHYLESEKQEWEYDLKNDVEFPETGFKMGSQEDKMLKAKYIKENHLNPDTDITFVERLKRVYKKRVFVPTLTRTSYFFDGEDSRQIGRLPFFPWGLQRRNNQYRGLADLLYDIQQGINKQQLDLNDIRQTSAKGSFFIDPDIVDNNEDEMQKVERDWNNGGARIWTKPGALGSGQKFIEPIPRSHIPPELLGMGADLVSWADEVSGHKSAHQGNVESERESGKLFQSKYEAGLIALGIANKTLSIHSRDKADAFYRLAKSLYAGRHRVFSHGDTEVEINQYVSTPYGVGVRDDISKLPRQNIIITQSKTGLTVQANQRAIFGEMMQYNQDPLFMSLAQKAIVETVEMDDDIKEGFLHGIDLLIEKNALLNQAEIFDAKARILQAQTMIQQSGMQMPEMASGSSPASVPQQITMGAPPPEEAAPEGTDQTNPQGEEELADIIEQGQT